MANSNNQPAIVIDEAQLGGISDSIYTGPSKSLASIVGFDLHSVPGLMLVNQKMTKIDDAAAPINDLVKIVPCSDGNIYFFGRTTGKVWKLTSGGVLSLEATILKVQTTGLKDPTAVVNDGADAGGTFDWASPSLGMTESDDTNDAATIDLSGEAVGVSSRRLRASGFGFAIPGAGTILAIEAQIKKWSDYGNAVDNGVCLQKTGNVFSASLGNSTTRYATIPSGYTSYGGLNASSPLWGATFAPADVNHADFGVWIRSKVGYTGGGGTGDFMYVDNMMIQVWYTDPATPANILDAREYNGYIYYAMGGKTLGRWKIGDAWSARNDQFAIFTNGDEDYHPMEEQNLVLYVGDGNLVAQVDSSSGDEANAVFSSNALKIPSSYKVSSLGKQNTNLLVGSKAKSNTNKAGVFNWNTWSPSFTIAHYIDEVGINAFIPQPDGTVLVNAGLNGIFYIYTGQALQAIKQVPPNFPTLYSPTNTAIVHHAAVSNKQGIPIFGFSRSNGNPALQGMYSFGARTALYPGILTLEFPISTGNLQNITIWSATVVGNDIYISWKDDTGSTVYGVDKLDWSNKINGAYFETRIMKYSKILLDKFQDKIVNYNQLPAGTGVKLYYNKNHAGYVEFAPATEFINDTDRKQYITEIENEAKTMQFKIEVVVTGNDAPSIEDVVVLVQ